MCLLLSVWAKLKSQKALERWQPDTEVSACGGSGRQKLTRCSCCHPCVSGGVRGLQRQRGQQEDLRGSEETGPAVEGNQLPAVFFYHPPSFYLYSVILFYSPSTLCRLFIVATVDHSNKLRTFVTVCYSAVSLFTAAKGAQNCCRSDLSLRFKNTTTVFMSAAVPL